MKKIVYILVVLAIPLSVHAFSFTRTLTLGSEGEDVLQLQKILNSTQSTLVSLEGVGSPGNETNYFGQKTKDAVRRFQEMYAQDILKPNGLSSGTGFVGTQTLTFLNSLEQNAFSTTTSITSPLTTPQLNQTLYEGIPQFLITKTIIQPGQSLFVGSQNNLKELDFFLNSILLKKQCRTEYTCEIIIPKNTKSGTYSFSTSNSSWGQYQITVLDSKIKKPEVKIKEINLTGDTLIKGKYFSPNVTIYTMYGVFKSETKNDSFILNFPIEIIQSATSTEGLFYIENDTGLVSDILIVQYEI